MIKLFGVALFGVTATGALAACAAPQPKYAVNRAQLAAAPAIAAAAEPAESPAAPAYASVPFADYQAQAEADAPVPAPVGGVETAALPMLVAAVQSPAPPPPAAAPARPDSAGGQALTHVVGAGETFYAVGRRYGVTPQAVAEANGLTFSSTLRVGQRLTLPAGARDRGAQAAFPGRAVASAAAEPARRPTRLPDAPAAAEAPVALARPSVAAVATPSPPTAAPAAVALAARAAASPPPAEAAPVARSESPAVEVPVPTAVSAAAPASLPPRTTTRYTASPAPLAASAAPLPNPVQAAAAAPAPAAPTPPPAAAASAPVPTSSPAAGQGRFIWPVRGEVLTGFGPRGPGQRNDGLNIAVIEGEPVRAAAGGEVVYAGDQVPGFGKLILLKHADGWVTAYAHLSEITVKMREQVRQGAEIGKAGRTGAVPSPQLHFEVRHAPTPQERARPVDPMPLLPQ